MNLTMVAACRRANTAFNPLSLSPYLALDFLLPNNQSRALKTGGTQAAYLDLAATWENPGTASDATQVTSASQFVTLAHETGANYLHLPGIAGNYASVPDEAALDIGGDLDLRAHVQLADWTPTTPYVAAAKYEAGGNYSYQIYINADGRLRATFGVGGGTSDVASTAPLTVANGDSLWLRTTRVASTGAYTLQTSVDGTSWTVVGSGAITAGVLTNSSRSFLIGANEDAAGPVDAFNLRGAIHRVQLFGSTNGTDERLDVNFAAVPHNSTSFVCATGQTVTINQSGNNPASIIGYPTALSDGVDDSMSGTSAADLDPEYIISVYTKLSTGVRGVRATLVSASEIISTSGTDWTILSGIAAHIHAAYVLPAATNRTRLISYLATIYGAADLT